MSLILTGRQPGRNQVVGAHERGGMADVCRGIHTSITSEVAIKVLQLNFLQDSSHNQCCGQVAKIIAGLQHPHTLPAPDSGEQGDLLYTAAAGLRGALFAERIHLCGGSPLDASARAAGAMATAGCSCEQNVACPVLTPLNSHVDYSYANVRSSNSAFTSLIHVRTPVGTLWAGLDCGRALLSGIKSVLTARLLPRVNELAVSIQPAARSSMPATRQRAGIILAEPGVTGFETVPV